MAQFIKRGARWMARVRIAGVSRSATFATRSDARAWAAQVEADIVAGKLGRAVNRSFGELLRRYMDEIASRKDGARRECATLRRMLGLSHHQPDELVHVRLPDIGPQHFAAWRDRRLREVSAATVRREWNLLSAACSIAMREWRWLPSHPMRGVKLPPPPPPRARRISDEEIERLLIACGYRHDEPPMTAQARVGAAFLFAIETAMRAGEICALRWSDVDFERRVIEVRAVERGARKTGSARTVPLSREALRLLDQVRTLGEDRVFCLSPSILDALFRKARERAMIDDLHFHDSRAEALTRLSRKLDVMQLARLSGHKDLRTLYDVYYRERPEDWAHKLD